MMRVPLDRSKYPIAGRCRWVVGARSGLLAPLDLTIQISPSGSGQVAQFVHGIPGRSSGMPWTTRGRPRRAKPSATCAVADSASSREKQT